MVKSLFLFTLPMFLFSERVCNLQVNWVLVEDREGITLYENPTDNDTLRLFKAEFTVPADVKTCVNILYNTEFHTSFMDGMKSSELVKYHNEKSLIFYQVIDLPWPIPNRDMVTHALFEHTPDFSAFTVRLKSSPDEKEATSMTRVNVPDRHWVFTRNADGYTTASYHYQTNPSTIPALLEDTFTIDGPMKMMARFKDLASQHAATPVNLAWIKE